MYLKRKPNSSSVAERIDRNAYEPIYVQLAQILRRMIVEGGLQAGNQLPSEAELCNRYQVSPMTVRRTISLLVDQGIVTTERGRGTYVKRLDIGKATFSIDDLKKLYSDAAKVEVKILEVKLVPADKTIATNLYLKEGDRTIHLRRLLNTNGTSLFYHYEYLACDIHSPIVEAELEATSLQGLFEGTGHNLFKGGKISISAGIMNPEEAEILKVKNPSAAFYLTHVFFGFDDRPMSWGRFVCRSDQVSFNTTVGIVSTHD